MNGDDSGAIDPDSDYIDLDAEVVHVNGERITEARAAQMADDAERLARERYSDGNVVARPDFQAPQGR